MFLPVIIFLCLVLSSFQKSTPADDHYVAAVVEFIVSRNVEQNTAGYEALIKEAAEKDADLIVFPELTLTNDSVSFAVPINGILKQYPIPALRPDLYDNLLVAMSAAARRNDIYVIINIRENVDCTRPQEGEECPEAKEYIFNTNVVIDRTGAVIDRYRKINLFYEPGHTPALKPDLGVFTTDFGVTFGHFICFDLMFQVPAVQVVQKMKVKDIVYPTMWFSELPYLTAVQIQEAYAYTMDVNLLGSGANNVRVGSSGSGIYSGKAGALVSIMPGLPTTKLLVAKVPKVPGKVTGPVQGPIYDNPSDHDSLKLLEDSSLASHITKPIVQGYQEITLVDKDVSCTIKVKLANRSNTLVHYRAFVKDGTNTYARREVGVASCAIIACKDDTKHSCPYKFNQTEEATIEELEIEMITYPKQYNKTLHCEDIEYYPLSFRYNKFPLASINFTYTQGQNNKNEVEACDSDNENVVSVFQKGIIDKNNEIKLKYKINKPQNQLVTFGIWGRVYNRDIDHNTDVNVPGEDMEQVNSILNRIYSDSD